MIREKWKKKNAQPVYLDKTISAASNCLVELSLKGLLPAKK